MQQDSSRTISKSTWTIKLMKARVAKQTTSEKHLKLKKQTTFRKNVSLKNISSWNSKVSTKRKSKLSKSHFWSNDPREIKQLDLNRECLEAHLPASADLSWVVLSFTVFLKANSLGFKVYKSTIGVSSSTHSWGRPIVFENCWK